jgi:hypothetical protein
LAHSLVDPATIEAYYTTDYRVIGDDGFVLRVSERSTALLATYQRCDVDCCAFITACNPHSQLLESGQNEARLGRLEAELREGRWSIRAGIGQHPSNGWPAEPSFLVLGIPLEEARALGARHSQNAIVWAGADALPQLVMLR